MFYLFSGYLGNTHPRPGTISGNGGSSSDHNKDFFVVVVMKSNRQRRMQSISRTHSVFRNDTYCERLTYC